MNPLIHLRRPRSSGRSRPDFTSEEGIARRINEGRGLGAGPTYKPWMTVADFRSSGARWMVWSSKLGRIVHLFSNLEYRAFLFAECLDSTIDIRECYPLDREATRRNAKALGIRHPAPYGTDIVMTCDLYLTVAAPGGTSNVAWTVKYAKEAAKPRVQAKFAIERACHAERGVDLVVITENSLPAVLIENLEFVRGTLRPRAMDGYSNRLLDRIDGLVRPQTGNGPLGEICEACDRQLRIAPGMALRAARYFIASRRWQVDLNVPIEMDAIIKVEAAA